MLAETFADLSLDAIALHRQRQILFRDGQAQSGMAGGAVGGDRREVRRVFPTSVFKDEFEFVGFEQTGAPGQARHDLRDRLRDQTLAALGATTRQDQTTALGRHAGTKTVSAGTTQIARLKSTFHGTPEPVKPKRARILSFYRKPFKRKRAGVAR